MRSNRRRRAFPQRSQSQRSADLLRLCASVFRTCHKPTVRLLGFQVSGFAVLRPLRTATRRSWQPGGFGDSCLPDGISWRAGLPIRGGDADAGCGLAVDVVTACRKNPLPTPLALGIRILALVAWGSATPPVPVARSRSCRALTL